MGLFLSILTFAIIGVFSESPIPAETATQVDKDDEAKVYTSLSSLLHRPPLYVPPLHLPILTHERPVSCPACQCNCQTLQCPENEYYVSCKDICNEKCERDRAGCSPDKICISGCTCKTGYARNSIQQCVPASTCLQPIPSQCPENEVYTSCLSVCDEKCPSERAQCFEIKPCKPGCTCIAGRARIGSICELQRKCS